MNQQNPQSKNKLSILLWSLVLLALGFVLFQVYNRASLSINANPLERYKQGTFSALEILKAPPSMQNQKFFDADGKQVTLSDFNAKIKIVNIWATWCPPCVREMPELAELSEKYKAQGVVLIPISIDKLEQVNNAKLELKKLSRGKLAFYSDPEMALPFPLLIKGFPTTIFYDEKNNEILRIGGAPNWKSKEADDLILGVLNTKNKK